MVFISCALFRPLGFGDSFSELILFKLRLFGVNIRIATCNLNLDYNIVSQSHFKVDYHMIIFDAWPCVVLIAEA